MKSWLTALFSFILVALINSEEESYTLDREIAKDAVNLIYAPLNEVQFPGMPSVYQNRQPEEVQVETVNGKVKGFATTTCRDGSKYYAFLGMPYAKPPIGARRFRAPEPADDWQGVYDATYERSSCVPLSGDSGSENCLFVNVFTQNVNPSRLKAVLFWIYGGAWIGGTSNTTVYSPDYFLDKDVVLVTSNYRIGPMGFLSLQNEEVPGNAGLKDQRLALEWTKKNIRSFGGDPEKITIFGESAGAASVSYQVLSKSSEGLFQQAIMQSGTALAPWAHTDGPTAKKNAISLGERVGCKLPLFGKEEKLLECLRNTDAATLCKSQESAINLQELFTLRVIAFTPTTEPNVKGAIITRHPYELLSTGDFNKVPVVMGMNSAEGLLLLPMLKKYDPFGILVSLVGADLTRLVPSYMGVDTFSKGSGEITKRIREYYFRGQPVTIFQRRELLNLVGDNQFTLPIQQTASLMATHSPHPVYNYYFTYDGPYCTYKSATGIADEPGVCHADEMGYMWKNSALEYRKHESRSTRGEEKSLDETTTMWTNFAKFGAPIPEDQVGKDGLITAKWEPFNSPDFKYLEIGKSLTAGEHLMGERIQFWNDIGRIALQAKNN